MRSRYRIRAAERRDLHRLPDIERSAVARFRHLTDPETEDLFEAYTRCFVSAEQFEARQHEGRLCVAVDRSERPVGFATWSRWGARAHLDEMDVHPRHGRRGIGTALLAAVCVSEARRFAIEMTLSTTRGVPWNEPFYRRHGFREIPESDYSHELRRLRAVEEAAGLPVGRRVVMRLPLTSSFRLRKRERNLVAKAPQSVL